MPFALVLLKRVKVREGGASSSYRGGISGVNVHCGPRIQPGDEKAMEYLALVHCPCLFYQERMTYSPKKSMVVYRAKDGRKEKAFDSLECHVFPCAE